jgi:8-oxo-dGTP pyrophosphatase MutT (NUDIX family)
MIDLLFRLLYRCAYRLMRVYWATFHPRVHGALVAVWHRGEVLVVRTSYAPFHQLPGGYVRRGETGAEAASRELLEELSLRVDPADLVRVADVHHRFDGKREQVEIFELAVAERPAFAVDRREVVDARFLAPDEALRLELFPPVRAVIERRARA